MKYILSLCLLVFVLKVDAQTGIQLTKIKNNKVTTILPGDPFTFSFLDSSGTTRGLHGTLINVNDSLFTFRVGMIDEMKPRFYQMPLNKITGIRKEGKYLYTRNTTMIFVTVLEVVPTVEFIVNNTATYTQQLLWIIPTSIVIGTVNGLIESAFWPTKPRRKIGEHYRIGIAQP
ncbi:MAG: hypothetical protein ACK44D_13305 [Bacteroidia bacterium]